MSLPPYIVRGTDWGSTSHRFTDRIAPWVHYIPVQVDLSDLYDSLVFFRGDMSGIGGHDDLARKIANAGRYAIPIVEPPNHE